MCIPYLVRWYQFGNAFHGFTRDTWDSWTYSALESIFSFLMMLINFTFVVAGFMDFQRRAMMLKACGTLIDPVKSNYPHIYRAFPTVNVAC